MVTGQRRWSPVLKVPNSRINAEIVKEMKQEDNNLTAAVTKSNDGEWITVYKFHPY